MISHNISGEDKSDFNLSLSSTDFWDYLMSPSTLVLLVRALGMLEMYALL